MPLAPIQQYQDPSNSLMQILQGGNQQIGSILDRAIQIGRDIANKRTQQEQDLAAMRNQETAMAQRRGENLQSVLDTQQKFGMEQDKFNFLKMDTQRKYDAQREDQAAQLGHQAWSEQFSQSQADRSAGFTERRLTLEEQAAQQRQAALDAEKQRLEAYATPPSQSSATTGPTNPASATPFEVAGPVNVLAAPDTTGKTFVSPLGRAMTASGARPFVNAAEAGGGNTPPISKLLAVPESSTQQAPAAVDTGSLKLDIRDAERRLVAAEKLGDRTKIEGWKNRLKGLYTQKASMTKAETPAEQRAQARFDAWQQDRAAGKTETPSLAPIRAQATTAGTALRQAVEGMPDAFQNPYGDQFAPKGETETDKGVRQSKAKQWATNPDAGERQAALSMSRATYADKFYKGNLSPEEVARLREARAKVWDIAQSEKSAQGKLMGSTPASPTSAVDFLNSQH